MRAAKCSILPVNSARFLACVQVRHAAAALREQLAGIPGLHIPGAASSIQSPVLHLQLSPVLAAAVGSRKAADLLLQGVADQLLSKHGLLVAVPRYSSLDRAQPPPSLKLYVHAGLPVDKVPKVAQAIRESTKHVLGPVVAKASS